jgi:hypothetical protein
MIGFDIQFKIYAHNEAEVQAARKAIVEMINGLADEGIAGSANKLAEIVPKWRSNAFIKQQITDFFRR